MVTYCRDVITSPVAPTASEFRQIAIGNQDACAGLVRRWERAIRAIACRYVARAADLDDLMQIGRVAVYRAALRYDASFEVPFGHYAKRAIKNQVIKEAVRLANQRGLETSLDRSAEAGEGRDAEIDHHQGAENTVRVLVDELPEPHSTVFRRLYIEGQKQRIAAQEMGVSQPRVAQLHRSFLALAREALAG